LNIFEQSYYTEEEIEAVLFSCRKETIAAHRSLHHQLHINQQLQMELSDTKSQLQDLKGTLKTNQEEYQSEKDKVSFSLLLLLISSDMSRKIKSMRKYVNFP